MAAVMVDMVAMEADTVHTGSDDLDHRTIVMVVAIHMVDMLVDLLEAMRMVDMEVHMVDIVDMVDMVEDINHIVISVVAEVLVHRHPVRFREVIFMDKLKLENLVYFCV